jgi:hypothetical protein
MLSFGFSVGREFFTQGPERKRQVVRSLSISAWARLQKSNSRQAQVNVLRKLSAVETDLAVGLNFGPTFLCPMLSLSWAASEKSREPKRKK